MTGQIVDIHWLVREVCGQKGFTQENLRLRKQAGRMSEHDVPEQRGVTEASPGKSEREAAKVKIVLHETRKFIISRTDPSISLSGGRK